MLSGRQLLAAASLVLAIAACERTITGPTVYVPVPRADTVLVPRVDTFVVQRPETSFVQLPGRVDTIVVTRPDTIVRLDTMRIVTHDTIVVHDTVTHVDTLWKESVLTSLCVVGLRADTVYQTVADTAAPCSVASLRLDFPTLPIVLVDTMRLVVGQTIRLRALPRYTVHLVSSSSLRSREASH